MQPVKWQWMPNLSRILCTLFFPTNSFLIIFLQRLFSIEFWLHGQFTEQFEDFAYTYCFSTITAPCIISTSTRVLWPSDTLPCFSAEGFTFRSSLLHIAVDFDGRLGDELWPWATVLLYQTFCFAFPCILTSKQRPALPGKKKILLSSCKEWGLNFTGENCPENPMDHSLCHSAIN